MSFVCFFVRLFVCLFFLLDFFFTIGKHMNFVFMDFRIIIEIAERAQQDLRQWKGKICTL